MKDEEKNRSQLIEELQLLRARLAAGEQNNSHGRKEYSGTNPERKEIAESLYLSRTIIDSANIGIFLIRPDGSIQEVNRKAAEMLGYTKEELENMSLGDIDRVSTPEEGITFWKNLEKENIQDFAMRWHRRKDGSLIPVEIYSNLLEYRGKSFSVAFTRDITQRLENEEQLKDKDRLLRDMERLVKIGAWKYGIEKGVSQWTDEVYRIFGLEPGGEANPEQALQFFDDKNRKILESAFYEAVKEGTNYDIEMEMTDAEGSHKWIRTICDPPLMKNGEFSSIQGSFQDITEKKMSEILVQKSEKKYRALINLAPLGFVVINSEGEIIDANQSLLTMLGYGRDELLNHTIDEMTHPEDIPVERKLLKDLKDEKIPSYSLEKRYKRKDGNFFWMNITVSKLENIYGDGLSFFGFVEDISIRKKMEKEREDLILDLKKALAEIQELREFIPICANCKRVRDDKGYWEQVEKYISDRSSAQFSHNLCPDCVKELYPELYSEIDRELNK